MISASEKSFLSLDGEVTFFPQMADWPSSGSESQVSQMIRPSQPLRTSRHSDKPTFTSPSPTPGQKQLPSKAQVSSLRILPEPTSKRSGYQKEPEQNWHPLRPIRPSGFPDLVPLSSQCGIRLAAKSAASALPRFREQFWRQAGRTQAAVIQ